MRNEIKLASAGRMASGGAATVAAFAVVAVFCPAGLLAAPLRNVPTRVQQPDGSVHQLRATGDEFFNWLHDAEGRVVVQDPRSGWYVYALDDAGEAAPSIHVLGTTCPPNLDVLVWGRPPFPAFDRRIDEGPRPVPRAPAPGLSPVGVVEGLTIFIRFSDETEFAGPLSAYESLFNSTGSDVQSVYQYFREASYGRLTVSSTFLPPPSSGAVVSYQDSHPRGYFRPYNAATNPIGYSYDGFSREMELVREAVNAVKAFVPADLNIDKDRTGRIDSVVLVVSGEVDAWSDLLWPHQRDLGASGLFINGKELVRYVLVVDKSLRTGILCHELMHTLGAPDLYHYTRDAIAPVWFWDIMELDSGAPHTSAYMKHRYMKWLDSIPEISTDGTYSLNPLVEPSGNAYKIKSPNSDGEFFVVEFRKKVGPFEGELPGEGLLVFRINASRDGMGNAHGPPDEIYLMRPNGRTDENGLPWVANLNPDKGMVLVNDSSNPRLFLSEGGPSGLMIHDVGAPGDTISFSVKFCGCAGRECGPDACGNWCGACVAGAGCDPDGVCTACAPSCGGRECGPDGCGGDCGRCAGTMSCADDGLCVAGCAGSGGLEEWAAWPMGGRCPDRQSRGSLTASSGGERRWSLRVGQPITATPTIDAGGNIYLGAADGNYHAFGPDGREKWKIPSGGDEPASEVVVMAGGLLVFGTQDGRLVVADKDGNERWSLDAGSPVVAAPAVADDGYIHFCTTDGTLHKAGPVLEEPGAFAWSYPAGGGCPSPPAIGPDGTVYLTNGEGGTLLAAGADGLPKWAVHSVFWTEESPIVAADGSIHFGDHGGTLYGVSPAGDVLWNLWVSGSPLGGLAAGQDGTLYVTSEDGFLYAVAPEPVPHVRWRYDSGNVLSKAPVIDAQGNIFFGGRQRSVGDTAYVHALAPDGALLWKFAAGGDVTGQTVVGLRGHIYAGCDDGILYILGDKCTPQCLGKACGDDNCGGACGECPAAAEPCIGSECSAGFRCEVAPSPAGAACDDRDPCTAGDRCDGAGKCAGGGIAPQCSGGGPDGGGAGDAGLPPAADGPGGVGDESGAGCSCSTVNCQW